MIVFLQPHAPFSKGVPRSDTLFGAIAWSVRLLYGEPQLTALLAEFDAALEKDAEPPFVLSSLLPYFEDEAGRILLLPRPLAPPAPAEGLRDRERYRAYKKLRGAKLVSLSVFEQLTEGARGEGELFAELVNEDGAYRAAAGAVLAAGEARRVERLPELVSGGELARNAINRLSVSTGGEGGQLFYLPYQAARLSRKAKARSGFYFLVRTGGESPATVEEVLKTALRFLGDKGLGGDTSIGRGHCGVEFADGEPVRGGAAGERLMTLSLMHPNAADVAHLQRHPERSFAQIERRKGFVESAFAGEFKRVWKPTLVMLAEGASFPRDGERRVYGSLYADDSRREGLDFRVRINGLAYTVALKGEG